MRLTASCRRRRSARGCRRRASDSFQKLVPIRGTAAVCRRPVVVRRARPSQSDGRMAEACAGASSVRDCPSWPYWTLMTRVVLLAVLLIGFGTVQGADAMGLGVVDPDANAGSRTADLAAASHADAVRVQVS